MNDPLPLTPSQYRCLMAISRLSNGVVGPSFKELGAELGMSAAGAFGLAEKLRERGWVAWSKTRSITVLHPDRLIPGTEEKSP
jgi:DNA-binding MarR family transcriptional regulator